MPAAKKQTTSESNLVKLEQAKRKPRKQKEEREFRPANNPEAREQQLVRLAVDLAEKQLTDGTASAAVMTHYLKLATRKDILEREILEKQARLIEAKAESLGKDKDSDALAKAAIDALKSYGPSAD